LLGLSGLIGSRLGQLWAAFDVFSQFTVQFACLSIAFAAAFVLPRFKILAAIVIFLALIAAYGSWPHLVSGHAPQPAELSPNERALKFASYNTHVTNLDHEAQAKTIRAMDADVIVLIEFDSAKRPILEKLKDLYPYQFDCNAEQYCHFAIISKTPLNNLFSQAIWEGPPNIRASLGPEFGGVTIIGVHTTRFPHSRAQLKQARALVQSLEGITGTIIMAGDFNATPFSRVTATLETGTGLIRQTNLPTWPAFIQLPQLAIDHIFTSPAIRPLTRQTIGDAGGSDHFPVRMTFAVPVRN
jgi:endonuclease/exonuclease/phosphatase (EEP) superfamily protein YafD